MSFLRFLGKLSKQEKGINDRITQLIKDNIMMLIYFVRKEQGLVLPRVRVTVWIPRENGETMQIEHETHVDIADYEKSFQEAKKLPDLKKSLEKYKK